MRRLWLALGLALWGCARGPLIERLTVDVVEGAEVLGLDRASVTAEVKGALQQAGFRFGDAPSDGSGWRLDLALGAQEPNVAKEAEGRVAATLSFKQRGRPAFDLVYRARRSAKANAIEAIQGASREAMSAVLRHLALEGAALLKLEKEQPLAWEKALARGGPEGNAALTLLVRTHNVKAAPALVLKLSGDDDELRQAMGLVVELGEPNLAKPMIEATQGRPLALQRELIFALASLGGPDSLAYLDLVAQGHDAPELRAWATQALEELQRNAVRRAPP
jgi:hypothetical protein